MDQRLGRTCRPVFRSMHREMLTSTLDSSSFHEQSASVFGISDKGAASRMTRARQRISNGSLRSRVGRRGESGGTLALPESPKTRLTSAGSTIRAARPGSKSTALRRVLAAPIPGNGSKRCGHERREGVITLLAPSTTGANGTGGLSGESLLLVRRRLSACDHLVRQWRLARARDPGRER
jgi:hypothetical protein